MNRFFIKILTIYTSLIFSQDIFEGYTLFTPGEGPPGWQNNYTTLLLNPNGSTSHTWSHTRSCASMPYITPDSVLIYPYRVQNPTMSAGGVGGGVQYITWDGGIIWDYQLSNELYQHHHDIQPLANGNVLMISWERKYQDAWSTMGRQSVNNFLNEMWSETILEIEPNELNSGNIVWEWHLWDHLIQDISSDYESSYGVISEHPELMNINYGSVDGGGPNNSNADWKHYNAIHYNEYLDHIVISCSKDDEIFIIDHSTTTIEAAGHIGGNSGKGGDILYRWGNPLSYERGNSDWNLLEHQHSVNWIPMGNPGAGNLILFNNNYTNNASAIYELELPMDVNGNYFIDENQPFGPETPLWILVGDFHTDMQGGAFRQPNGNTLITDCDSGRIFEVNPDGIEYEIYQSIFNIARAQKYPPEFFNPQNDLLGDVNTDGEVNILDIVSTINIVLSNEYLALADINQDGQINVLDIVILVNIILS